MSIPELLQQLTLEEKASLCSGGDFWHTKAIERLGIPAMMMSDGPHGLRKQDETGDHMGINDSIKAVCFPAGCATASSFDRGLVERMGKALGNECQAENVGVLLGPAVNIKRSPLCGRNFEYYSEDPYVAGEMAASFIQGVQSQQVGTSIKHFYANNQEHRRMSSSSEMNARTAREIYLAAFERPIRKAKPWTVMCAYNRINGVYAAENKEALTDILRGEWNFHGFVVSDWGAVNDRVADLESGMDLEMPSSFGMRDAEIVKAVRCGRLPEAVLDRAVTRILRIVQRYLDGRNPDAVFDRDADHELAREIASQCMVLLKNEDHILPLSKTETAAFIGKFAESPRFQGGGSSHINCHKVESALEMAADYPVLYAKGYETSDDVVREDLMAEAVAAAKAAKVAVVFAGLPDTFESEGYDREHMRLPDCQNALIEAVAEANPNTVVVLHGGSPVEMPWLHQVRGVLEAYLCGQAVGGATVQILYGDVNPSGHLAETFPIKLEDNPSYVAYQGEGDVTEYREGVFVGYRYYTTKKMPVLFPFGFGLSYTTFAVSNLRTAQDEYQSHRFCGRDQHRRPCRKRSGTAVCTAPDQDRLGTASGAGAAGLRKGGTGSPRNQNGDIHPPRQQCVCLLLYPEKTLGSRNRQVSAGSGQLLRPPDYRKNAYHSRGESTPRGDHTEHDHRRRAADSPCGQGTGKIRRCIRHFQRFFR